MLRFLKNGQVLMFAWAMFGLLLVVSAVQAGTIVMGTPVATSDGGLDVSVNVTPDSDQDVAALQFDLHYDSSQYGFADAASGGAAAGAGKDAAVSETDPGTVRVVVAGINQDAIGSGTVVTLHFERMDKTASTSSFSDGAALDEVVASGPSGENVEGLDVSAAVSEVSAATATESNSKTSSVGASASSQNIAGNTSTGTRATGSTPALESALGTSDGVSPRNAAGAGASVVGARMPARGNPQDGVREIPQISSDDTASRQGAGDALSASPVRAAKASIFNGRRGDPQSHDALAAHQNAEGVSAGGRSARLSPVARSGSHLDRTHLAATVAISPPLPEITSPQASAGALRMGGLPNPGVFVLCAGGLAVLVLLFCAWAVRRG